MNHQIAFPLGLLAFAFAGSAQAADGPPRSERHAGPEVTMRIIEDPDALGADTVIRRIELPALHADHAEPRRPDGYPAEAAADGLEISEAARERGREFGAEVSDRARDLREQASEQREEFGRARAEEARPERPEPPEVDPPTPPGD